MIADELDAIARRQIAATSLRTFMRLPVAQRSSVILMDVLGCSLQEVCDVMDFSLPAVKAALHRGSTRLRELADEPDDAPRPRLVGRRSRAAFRLCRPFQCARFRRHPRHDRRRCPARARQQDAAERQGRSVALFRQLSQDQRLASGAGLGGGQPGDPGVRSRTRRMRRRNISCCWPGRPTRSRPSGISATRPMWSRPRIQLVLPPVASSRTNRAPGARHNRNSRAA